MNISQRTLILFCILFTVTVPLFAMNLLLRPYDTLLRPIIHLDRTYELSVWIETGIHRAKGFDASNGSVDVLSIWAPNQNALTMLYGFDAKSPMTQLVNALDASDNGIRGHLKFNSALHLDFGSAIGARWFFLPHAWFTAYLPFYKTRLETSFIDLTPTITPADIRVKNLVTNNIHQLVHSLANLNLSGWQRTGLGDLNVLVEWLFDFPQPRPLLKNVSVDGRVGFTFPTGLRADPDKVFAFAYGYDGAIGIVYGGGLAVQLGTCFKAGFDVQLLHLFGNTKERRIKTHSNQTDLLLLAKTKSYKDYGLTQRFNLYLEAPQFWNGLSFLAGYQFLKHGQDSLQLETCQFSNTIANTAVSLEEWIVHSLEFNLNYDFNTYDCSSWPIAPQISLFARIPFNGKRAAAFTTIGVTVALDF